MEELVEVVKKCKQTEQAVELLFKYIRKTPDIERAVAFTIEKLRELGLIYYSKESKYIDMHPVIRQFFTKELN